MSDWSPLDEVFAELEALRFENEALWEGQLVLLSLLERRWDEGEAWVREGLRVRRSLGLVAAA